MYDSWFEWLRKLQDLKQGRIAFAVPVINGDGCQVGHLELLSQKHLDDESLVQAFCRWRNQNRSGWLDQRMVDVSSTTDWLRDVVTNPRRFAHLIYCADRIVGRCGTVNMTPHTLESDSLVRGERGGGLYFMHWAQVSALIWTFRASGVSRVVSKVVSTNFAALESCQRLGYDTKSISSRPLYRDETADGLVIREYGREEQLIDGQSLYFVTLGRDAFYTNVVRNTPFERLDEEVGRDWERLLHC
jgi:hypothetical protein